MPLSRFLGIHEGETGWIFGKGPSLATFDFNTAGKLRFAINDVIAHIPACKYGFANDGVAKWADVYWPDQILFQPRRCLHEYDSTQPGAVACEVVTYHDSCEDSRLILPPEQLLHELTIRRGTLGSAIQIIRIMGVRTLHLVGIDGGGQHAPDFEWRTRLRADHAADYNAIRSSTIDTARLLGITLHFHNQTDTMTNDGRIFVRLTRNCFAQGLPYSDGEIASFSPKVAGELISNRCAEAFTPPAAPVKETAVAPPAPEKAIQPPAAAKKSAKK